MSRNIIWDGSSVWDSVNPGVAPGAVQIIRNSYDARGKMEMVFAYDDTGAGSYVIVTMYIWNGSAYVKTGSEFRLQDGEENIFFEDGGQYYAVMVDDTNAFGLWSLNVGYVMFNN